MGGISTGVTRLAGDGLEAVLQTYFTRTGATPLAGSLVETVGDIVRRPFNSRSTFAMVAAGADDLEGLAPMLQLRGELPAEIGNLVTATGRARSVSLEGWLALMRQPGSQRHVAALDVSRITDPRFQAASEHAVRSVEQLFDRAPGSIARA